LRESIRCDLIDAARQMQILPDLNRPYPALPREITAACRLLKISVPLSLGDRGWHQLGLQTTWGMSLTFLCVISVEIARSKLHRRKLVISSAGLHGAHRGVCNFLVQKSVGQLRRTRAISSQDIALT